MKKIIKILYLIILYGAICSALVIMTDARKDFPSDLQDKNDTILSNSYVAGTNSVEYNDGMWLINGEDPYIIYGDLSKNIYGLDLMLHNVQDDLYIVVYYNAGKGFNQGQTMRLENKGNGVYSCNLMGYINELRIDFEAISVGTSVSDFEIVLHSEANILKKRLIFLVVINLILVVIMCFFLYYEIAVKNISLKLVTIKTVICAVFIGMSERGFFRLPIGTKIITFLLNLCVVLCCTFFSEKIALLNDTEKEDTEKDDIKEEMVDE